MCVFRANDKKQSLLQVGRIEYTQRGHIHHSICSNWTKKAFAWHPMAMIFQQPISVLLSLWYNLTSFLSLSCCLSPPLSALHLQCFVPILQQTSSLFGSIIVRALFLCLEPRFVFLSVAFFAFYIIWLCFSDCSLVIWLSSLFWLYFDFICFSFFYVVLTSPSMFARVAHL